MNILDQSGNLCNFTFRSGTNLFFFAGRTEFSPLTTGKLDFYFSQILTSRICVILFTRRLVSSNQHDRDFIIRRLRRFVYLELHSLLVPKTNCFFCKLIQMCIAFLKLFQYFLNNELSVIVSDFQFGNGGLNKCPRRKSNDFCHRWGHAY